MKALIILLVLAKGVLATPDVIPQSIKEEMVSEEPQYREAFPLSPLLVVVVMHFPKAKLWVITKIHLVAPDRWRFTDKDIEYIGREVDGLVITIFERKEEA